MDICFIIFIHSLALFAYTLLHNNFVVFFCIRAYTDTVWMDTHSHAYFHIHMKFIRKYYVVFCCHEISIFAYNCIYLPWRSAYKSYSLVQWLLWIRIVSALVCACACSCVCVCMSVHFKFCCWWKTVYLWHSSSVFYEKFNLFLITKFKMNKISFVIRILHVNFVNIFISHHTTQTHKKCTVELTIATYIYFLVVVLVILFLYTHLHCVQVKCHAPTCVCICVNVIQAKTRKSIN